MASHIDQLVVWKVEAGSATGISNNGPYPGWVGGFCETLFAITLTRGSGAHGRVACGATSMRCA